MASLKSSLATGFGAAVLGVATAAFLSQGDFDVHHGRDTLAADFHGAVAAVIAPVVAGFERGDMDRHHSFDGNAVLSGRSFLEELLEFPER